MNSNLVFKWPRALHAGEYDLVELVPVTMEAPAREIEQLLPEPVASAASASCHRDLRRQPRVRIEGSSHEAALLLGHRMLLGPSGPTA
ncbi:hypothetical protein [Burkholderia stabilis]|uniref:hypothetical protein n=1 Tax=Burkholderia stabilis TaxID=95485 RepID=UPI0012EA13D3|nr:hypothetical protein [Burkholderia stabilis]